MNPYITENNDTFYPTPKHLIEKMLNKIKDWRAVTTILEPSAGKGDLLAELMLKRGIEIDAIEIDPNLQYILKDKGFKLVHDDFLTYWTQKHYDLILANFPFNEGAKHFLKALQLQENGGAIIALINAETLKNQYTNERKLLYQKLMEYNADIEYLQDEFKNAERKTNVEVALVTVHIETKKQESFLFERLKKAHDEEYKDFTNTEIMHGDYIKAIISQYQFEIKIGLNIISEYKALTPYILNSIDDKYSHKILELKLTNKDCDDTMENGYIKQTRAKYWKVLFQNPKFTSKLTSNLQTELFNKVSKLKDYEFSEFNIMEIEAEIHRNTIKGVEDTILALFDKLSGDHSWYPETKKNVHYYNGWATNKAHKINNKVILPINGFSSWNYSGKTEWRFETYKISETISDILKTIDYLTGRTNIVRDVGSTLDTNKEKDNFKNIEFDYFTVDFFKKGTTHIKFKSQEIVDILNIYGARKRNWLPPHYGKVNYEDLSKEEQIIIDEFQGKKEYEKVMRNKKLYLFEAEKTLMIDMDNK